MDFSPTITCNQVQSFTSSAYFWIFSPTITCRQVQSFTSSAFFWTFLPPSPAIRSNHSPLPLTFGSFFHHSLQSGPIIRLFRLLLDLFSTITCNQIQSFTSSAFFWTFPPPSPAGRSKTIFPKRNSTRRCYFPAFPSHISALLLPQFHLYSYRYCLPVHIPSPVTADKYLCFFQ